MLSTQDQNHSLRACGRVSSAWDPTQTHTVNNNSEGRKAAKGGQRRKEGKSERGREGRREVGREVCREGGREGHCRIRRYLVSKLVHWDIVFTTDGLLQVVSVPKSQDNRGHVLEQTLETEPEHVSRFLLGVTGLFLFQGTFGGLLAKHTPNTDTHSPCALRGWARRTCVCGQPWRERECK